MPLALFCAAALLADAWDLKPSLSSTSKSTWEVAVDVSENGQDHHATFDLLEAGKEGDASKGQPVHLEIANVLVETNPQPGTAVDGVVNAQNLLQSTTDADANRRMFSPLLFIYPTAPVSVGDTWKADLSPSEKDAPKATFEFTAKKVEQVDGADSLQVTSTVKEAGEDGVSADGTWWVDKTGKVLKFKLTMKKWLVVPAGGQAMDATLTGKLKS